MNEGKRNSFEPDFNPERIGFTEVHVKTKEEAIALIQEFWTAMNLAQTFPPNEYLEEITRGDRTYAKEDINGWIVYFNGNWNPMSNKAYQWLKEKDLLKNSRKV